MFKQTRNQLEPIFSTMVTINDLYDQNIFKNAGVCKVIKYI